MDLDKCKEIRRFLNETVIPHLKKTHGEHFRDRQIFEEVFGDTPAMHEKFLKFLHDSSSCPPEVMNWCKRLLNPKTARNQKQSRGTRFVRNGGHLCQIRVVQGVGYAFRTKPYAAK